MLLHAHRPLYAPHVPPVFAATNRAGSVGKTSIGYNLCVQAARRGWKVLFIDADLQSDASFWAGWDGDQLPKHVMTVHNVLLGEATLKDAMVPARTRIAPPNEKGEDPDSNFAIIDNLWLIRGDEKMSQADTEMAQDPRSVWWLQRALRRGLQEGDFDFIWIDCPASLSLLSISLLLATTNVVLFSKPGRKEFRGIDAMIRRVAEIRDGYEELNPSCEVTWYVLNETKATETQGKFYTEKQKEARIKYGDRVLGMVRGATVVPEAYDAQEPLSYWVAKHDTTLTIDAMLTRMGITDRLAA
ncbi:AAA family ATPase [Kitasatospora sp. NPDC086791]|uniref:ParA family protein n=1 Tax=unclassified Kitasatospora TaxID=2633591 RepID=UPI003419266F